MLQPQLIKLIGQANSSGQIPESIVELWQWQSYLRRKRFKGSLIPKFFRRLVFAVGLRPLFVIASAGFLLLFIYYRGLINLTVPEVVLLVVASLYCMWFVLVFIVSGFTDLSSVIKDRTKQA